MYKVLYDATAPLFAGHLVGDGFLIVCLGLFVAGLIFLLWFYRAGLEFSFRAPGNLWIMAYGFVGISTVVAIGFLADRLLVHYESEHYARVVSGVVRDYVPWEPHVHTAVLTVDDRTFTFWGNINDGLWDSSTPLDIHKGDSIRLTLLRDSIVKVERGQK